MEIRDSYWAKSNARFDGRYGQMLKIGFRGEASEEYKMGMLVLREAGTRKVLYAVPHQTLLHADEEAWEQVVAYCTRLASF